MKYLIFFLVCWSLPLAAQMDEANPAAEKIYKEIMTALGKRNFSAIDSLGNAMYETAKGENDPGGMAKALSTLAMMANYREDYHTADSIMRLSIGTYEEAKMFDGLASCYGELSGIQRKSGNIEKAFEYARKGQSLLDKCEMEQTRIFNSNIISLLFKVTGQMDSCIHYQLEVIDLLPPTDSFGLTQGYNNLSGSFLTIGNYEKRKEYLEKALAISKDGSSSRGLALYNLSDHYLGERDLTEAADYAQQSLHSYIKSGSKSRLKDGYLAVAKVFLADKDYGKAQVYLDTIASLIGNQQVKFSIDYLLASLELAIESDRPLANGITIEKIKEAVYDKDHLDHKVRLHSLLHRYYRKKGDFKAAEENLQLSLEFSKDLTSKQNIQIVNNLEEQYETKQKELQIENLELTTSRQKQGLWIGGTALGLISLLSFFLYRLYRKVHDQKNIISKALSEKELLLREIHHRVKNNLQLVSSLLTLQGRSIDDEMAQAAIQEGKSRVRSMALIHQDLYNKENLTDIGVKEYIEKLSKELFQTYNISSDRIQLYTDIEDIDLDVDTLVPLGLIINELITNSLKYAFPDGQSGILNISLKRYNEQLSLSIKDDGVGYDPTQVRDNSFGATLITALTDQLEGKMKVDTAAGTKVDVVIPSR